MPRGHKPNPNRAAALLAGEPTYMGPRCKRDHDGLRRTDSAACIHCQRERSRWHHHNHRDEINAKQRQKWRDVYGPIYRKRARGEVG